ncbi:TonB-dependent receptor [Sphingomonas sp. H39-1-10]|uniref:TonB-dependent receptor n=1 Tax=Sphingomonas TaxID=13687 RepID=UPI000881C80D|nr:MULTISPECIES: TonB-dependent receptor [Sphingomonas]MDF0486518.1 TonB-dependent receptor [Sphingomonas pollutisoli]SDA22400.1 iron complex outermembrane recepter protein [Sphingomonas sp. NFR15]
MLPYSPSSSRRLLAATALCLSLAATPAFAEEPAPAAAPADASDTQGLADIVVTAQKRPESLQKTPISISVISDQGLQDRHVVSLVDLGDGAIPSLKVAPFYSRNSALIVNIRGVGVLSDGNQPARDQGVGVYIDGVYMGRAQGLGTALFDVNSIEVLKGPQGTLFGRNTEGGAVNITTKKPTGEFHVNALAGAGNYGSYKGELHVDLPEFHNISIKLDGVVAHRDPLVKNPLQGAYGFNFYDKHGAHVEALWQPSDAFSADYSYDTSYDASTSLYLQLVAPGTNKQAALGTIQSTRASVANVGVPEQPSVGRTDGHRLTLEYKLAPSLLVKSITAYRELTQSQYDNGSAATTMSVALSAANPTGNFTGIGFSRYSLAQFRQNQFSQEVQAIGDLPGFKYVVGALYYQEHVQDNAQAFNTNQFTNAAGSAYTLLSGPAFNDYTKQSIDRASYVQTTSMGVFGQGTYTPPLLDDAIHITGGLRWTRDIKHGKLLTVNNALPVDRNGVSGAIHLDHSWSRVDPMINAAVDVAQGVMLYGKWSTGYKSGGANSRSQEYDEFNPETVSMFEIGAKTEFFDRHARFNVAAYAGSYKDIQVDFSRPYETGGVRTNRTTTSTINAPGTGGLHGVEAELTLLPVRGLTLTGSYAYNYVRIPATVNPYPNAAGNLSTIAVPIYQTYTPEHSGSVAVDYELPMDGFTVRAHLDGNFDSGFYSNANDPVYLGVGAAGNVPQPKGEKATVFNGNIALADIDMADTGAKVSLSFWVRNLFDEQHMFYKALSPTSGMNGFFNEPRTFGGQVQVKF